MPAAQTPSPETSAGERVELVSAAEDLGGTLSDAMMDQWDLNVAHDGASLDAGLGRTTVSVKDLKNLRKGQVIGLDKVVGETFGIFANGQRLASGEVVSVAQERYGVRVIALAEESDQPAEEGA